MTEYRIIKEEPISFGSRLDQLMREKHVTNETVASWLPHCSKTTVNNWRTGKHDIRRYKDKYCKILGNYFDVDPEYLKCTQLEKKKKKRKKIKGWFKEFYNKRYGYNGSYWIDKSVKEKVDTIREMQEQKKEMSAAISLHKEMQTVFKAMGISIFDETGETGTLTSKQPFKIIEDGFIRTVELVSEADQLTGNCYIEFPDGSGCIRTPEEVKEIYQSMKESFINNLKG